MYGENQDAKVAAKAAKEEALLQKREAGDTPGQADVGGSGGENREGVGGDAVRHWAGGEEEKRGGEEGGGRGKGREEGRGLTRDVRREDAFFELFW